MNESALLNDIVRALYPYARLYRINVIRVKNTQGRWLTTGVPKGLQRPFRASYRGR